MVDPLNQLEQAVDALRRGGLVVYPTETLYGLGADATDETSLRHLVAVKGRAAGKPISVLIGDRAMLESLVTVIPAMAEVLMRRFWPGPLTLALPARPGVSPILTGGGGTIAVRHSSHPLASALVAGLGRPITTPSANPAGQPPPRLLAQARAYFADQVDAYVDGGGLPGGGGSTVVDLSSELRIVRQGAILSEEIDAALRAEK